MYSTDARSSGSIGATGEPRHDSEPWAARDRPAAMRSSVVLPLPLAPVTTSASPAVSLKSTPENSVASPRCAASCFDSSIEPARRRKKSHYSPSPQAGRGGRRTDVLWLRPVVIEFAPAGGISMPWSSRLAVHVARCAATGVPILLALAIIVPTFPAHAITAIFPKNTLIAEVGRPFTATFIPVNSHLPKYPVDWSLSPGGCLASTGISLDPLAGTLSGTPTQAGSFNCTVVAVDTFPDPVTTAQQAFTLVIESPPCVAPAITSGPPPVATFGIFYAFPVTASGDPQPHLSVDGLPSGLAFDPATGLISGVPAAAGQASLTITATSSCATTAQSALLSVNRGMSALSLAAQPEVAIFGQPITARVIASGGPKAPQGAVQLCVRGTGMFCGPPFDTVPPGTPPDRIAAPVDGILDASGRATFQLAGLTIDAFVLTAYFGGDDAHFASTSPGVDELVIKGVLLPPPPPEGRSAIAASSQASAIPALSSVAIALLSVIVAALAMASLRRRPRR